MSMEELFIWVSGGSVDVQSPSLYYRFDSVTFTTYTVVAGPLGFLGRETNYSQICDSCNAGFRELCLQNSLS